MYCCIFRDDGSGNNRQALQKEYFSGLECFSTVKLPLQAKLVPTWTECHSYACLRVKFGETLADSLANLGQILRVTENSSFRTLQLISKQITGMF